MLSSMAVAKGKGQGGREICPENAVDWHNVTRYEPLPGCLGGYSRLVQLAGHTVVWPR